MTSFTAAKHKADKKADGNTWLTETKKDIEDVFASCVADYQEGESVEDFALVCFESSWELMDQKLRESFRNGKRTQQVQKGR